MTPKTRRVGSKAGRSLHISVKHAKRISWGGFPIPRESLLGEDVNPLETPSIEETKNITEDETSDFLFRDLAQQIAKREAQIAELQETALKEVNTVSAQPAVPRKSLFYYINKGDGV